MGSSPEQSKPERRASELAARLRQDPGLPVKGPTSSYWQLPPKDLASAPLPEEVLDVVIIGSGITGCSVAKRLLESDDSIRVAVLEARNVCSGATGRNGGHIKAVPEHSYADNIEDLGLERTREILHFTLANVDALLNVVPTLPTDLQQYCEVRRVDSLSLFTDERVFNEFKEALDAYEKANPDLNGRGRIVPLDELRPDHGVQNAIGGYLSPAGAAWPYRLVTGIFAELLDKYRDRFTVHAQSPVESVRWQGGTYHVSTPSCTVRAKIVVHATNGFAGHLLPGLRGALFPVRGQMTTQTPSEAFGNKYDGKRSWSIYYDTGFDYITQSGETGEIFHGGGLAQSIQRGVGEFGNTRDDINSVQALAHLGGALNATFGLEKDQKMASDTKAAWTGVMGFTSDGRPLAGRLPQEATLREGDGEWIAGGYNGYGMANAWLCGCSVADSVLRKEVVEPIPQAYKISSERLRGMTADVAAKHLLALVGMD